MAKVFAVCNSFTCQFIFCFCFSFIWLYPIFLSYWQPPTQTETSTKENKTKCQNSFPEKPDADPCDAQTLACFCSFVLVCSLCTIFVNFVFTRFHTFALTFCLVFANAKHRCCIYIGAKCQTVATSNSTATNDDDDDDDNSLYLISLCVSPIAANNCCISPHCSHFISRLLRFCNINNVQLWLYRFVCWKQWAQKNKISFWWK